MPEPLAKLQREIEACRVCAECPAGPPLPHEPRPVARLHRQARILIVGQAAGTRVHRSGLPFDDPSGDRLRAWLGVTREVFYDPVKFAFAPMGFCFPGLDAKGGDLPPRKECAPLWQARVLAALPEVSLLLLIGRHAQRWHLGKDDGPSLGVTVRELARTPRRGPAAVTRLALPHPSWRNTAWLKANPWFAAEVLPRLQDEVARRAH